MGGALARIGLLAAIAAVLLSAAGIAAARPYGRVAGNPADRLAHLPVEDYRYDHASRCHRRPSRGARALERWLGRNSRGSSWGIMRCEKLGSENYSLHAEGRALDWQLDARRARDRRAARRLIHLLLATDRAGNPHALARRMGVQEIIWDCKSWWSGSDRMERYSACYDRRGRRKRRLSRTLAHRDHVHIGLNRSGARLRTSFWR